MKKFLKAFLKPDPKNILELLMSFIIWCLIAGLFTAYVILGGGHLTATANLVVVSFAFIVTAITSLLFGGK